MGKVIELWSTVCCRKRRNCWRWRDWTWTRPRVVSARPSHRLPRSRWTATFTQLHSYSIVDFTLPSSLSLFLPVSMRSWGGFFSSLSVLHLCWLSVYVIVKWMLMYLWMFFLDTLCVCLYHMLYVGYFSVGTTFDTIVCRSFSVCFVILSMSEHVLYLLPWCTKRAQLLIWLCYMWSACSNVHDSVKISNFIYVYNTCFLFFHPLLFECEADLIASLLTSSFISHNVQAVHRHGYLWDLQ